MALKLCLSVLALFLLLHLSASALGSLRGEAGVAVCAIVLAGTLVAQRLLFGEALAAVVHFVMQGAVKVVEMPGSPTAYQMMWLAACAVVPWLGLALPLKGSRPL